MYADLNQANLGACGVLVSGHADCEPSNNCYRKRGHVEQMPRISFIEHGALVVCKLEGVCSSQKIMASGWELWIFILWTLSPKSLR